MFVDKKSLPLWKRLVVRIVGEVIAQPKELIKIVKSAEI